MQMIQTGVGFEAVLAGDSGILAGIGAGNSLLTGSILIGSTGTASRWVTSARPVQTGAARQACARQVCE